MPSNFGKRVLVLGSEGAVGRVLCKKLALSKKVSCVMGVDSKPPSQEIEGLVSVQTDLTQPDFIEELVLGFDTIFNAAAIVDISASYEKLHRVNTDLVERLVNSVNEDTLILHISSGSVYEVKNACSFLKENSPLKATNDYELSKIYSEEILFSSGHKNFIIFRPGMIYGPGATALGASVACVPPLLCSMTGTKKLPFFSGGPQTNWVHCEDVARALIHCSSIEDVDYSLNKKIFNLAEDKPVPFAKVLNAALTGYGCSPLCTLPFPPRDILGFASPLLEYKTTFDALNFLLEKANSFYNNGCHLKLKIDKEAAGYLTKDVVFDNTSLVEQANFEYLHDIEFSLSETMKWYTREGWI